jgi:hypothetical protein
LAHAMMVSFPPVVARVLFEDRYVSLTLDPARGLVRYVRTREPFPTLDAMRASNAAIAASGAGLLRASLTLLLDLREAPPRNDEDFESEATKALARFAPGFKAHAFLVKTAVGRLQATRMTRDRGDPAQVFITEAEALAHLGHPENH